MKLWDVTFFCEEGEGPKATIIANTPAIRPYEYLLTLGEVRFYMSRDDIIDFINSVRGLEI